MTLDDRVTDDGSPPAAVVGDVSSRAGPRGSGRRDPLEAIVGDSETFLACFASSVWVGRSPEPALLFGIDAFDTIVSNGVRTPAVRMIRGGERVAPADFCSPTRIGATTLSDVADARKVLDLYRAGATVILQSLHRTWPAISLWCAELERRIGWPVQANAYLTPPHERGLAPHYDGHDVLVVQLHGCKYWTVDGMDDQVFRTGDVLYMPAGTNHCAGTREEPSLHLTIGIHRPTADRVELAALRIARERVGSGRSVPDVAMAMATVELEDAIASLRRPARTPADGLLAAAIRRAELDESVAVEPAIGWNVAPHPDGSGRIVLTWDSGVLNLPGSTSPALARLTLGRGPISDIPGLPPADRFVLVRRLLDEGALRVAS